MDKTSEFFLNEADVTRQAQRLRAETFAGWVCGLRKPRDVAERA